MGEPLRNSMAARQDQMLIGGSSLHSASPSPFAMGQVLGWVATKPTSNRKITCLSKKPNMPSLSYTYVIRDTGTLHKCGLMED